MRILYLTQWFQPEPAFKGADFASALAAAGHHVEVATAFPNYPGGKLYPGYKIRPYTRDSLAGVTVHRLAVYPSHDGSSLGRIANYLSFFLSALIFGLLRGGRYDVVYVYHPPLTPGIAAALFSRVHRIPMIIEIQDLWPDSVASSGMANKRVVGLLNRLCAFVYRRAHRIIPQSQGMRNLLEQRDVPATKMSVIRNWATYVAEADSATALPPAIADALSGRFSIVYGGNIGQAQALDYLIRAAVLAHKSCPELALHLFGDGIDRDRLAALALELNADCVTFHGSVSREAIDRIFDAADVLALHLAEDPLYDVTIPSKVQHYLACGKPIIAGVSGEAADILRASGAAYVVAPQDIDGLAAAMIGLARTPAHERATIGAKGRACYVSEFAFDAAVDRTLAIISDAVAESRRESTA